MAPFLRRRQAKALEPQTPPAKIPTKLLRNRCFQASNTTLPRNVRNMITPSVLPTVTSTQTTKKKRVLHTDSSSSSSCQITNNFMVLVPRWKIPTRPRTRMIKKVRTSHFSWSEIITNKYTRIKGEAKTLNVKDVSISSLTPRQLDPIEAYSVPLEEYVIDDLIPDLYQLDFEFRNCTYGSEYFRDVPGF